MTFKKCVTFIFGVLIVISSTLHASEAPTPENTYSKDDVVTLYGEVNATTAAKVIIQLQAAQKGSDTKPILFFINSPGGDVFQGIRIVDAMLASKRPIYTIDIGIAASMAAYIHSYGTKRFMLPHSILMYHNASSTYSGDVNHLKNQIIMLMTIMNDLNQNVSKRSGIPLEELITRENTEWWVTSGEAASRNLVDSVVNTMDYPIAVPEEKPATDSILTKK